MDRQARLLARARKAYARGDYFTAATLSLLAAEDHTIRSCDNDPR